MEHSSATVSRQQTGISDLPDEVFVLILILLPFPDQMRVRSVSKYWKTAVHFLFSKQETIRISLQEKAKYELDVREWELDFLGFNFDSGIKIIVTHPPERDRNQYNQECPVKKQAVSRFCNAVNFIIQHFNQTTIAEISWAFERMTPRAELLNYKLDNARLYSKQDHDRMHEVCNKFASRFQNQLLCFVCPMFRLTPQYFFPVLKHVTLFDVSQGIRNMFRTRTPKLVSLLSHAIELYPGDHQPSFYVDNMQHLPADLRCFSLNLFNRTHAGSERVYERLRHCRTTIQIITGGSMVRDQHAVHFPNLRLLHLVIWNWDRRDNILTLNAAGLQHLEVVFLWNLPPPSPSIFSHVMFHNLQSLVISCEGESLLDILSRTTHRLTQLIVPHCRVSTCYHRAFFTRLSDLIRFLTIFQIKYRLSSYIQSTTGDAEISLADTVLMLLRGKARATLKHVMFRAQMFGHRPISGIEMEAIAAELRLMQESESLEVGVVNDQLLTAGKTRSNHAFDPATSP